MFNLRHPRRDEALIFSKYIIPVVKCIDASCPRYHIRIMRKPPRMCALLESSVEEIELKDSYYYYYGQRFRIFGDYEVDENNKNKIIEFLIEKFWSK
jgi:hypothetical protein